MEDDKHIIHDISYYQNKYPDCEPPEIWELKEWMEEGGCETPSGAWVEADGYDSDGNPSWMIVYGLI